MEPGKSTGLAFPSSLASLPAPGDRIAGKYDVVRVVGEGGMGIVYEVVHTRLQQRAAIKMLQPRVQAMADVSARFEREARAACRLRSRYAVRISDVDHDERGRAYMVMEFLEGHDLSAELEARRRLPPTEGVDVLLQACVAMAEAHVSGVVHRDLKPSNLFLVNEGGERIVKVLDFGISKLTAEGEAAVTSTFATMGTPLYMSPEQIRSTKNVDARTDIWSLGVILYEVLAGERPFQGTTTAAAAAIVADEPPPLRSFAPEVPEGLQAVVHRTLAKKPEDRFADVRAFAHALAPYGSNRDALRAIESSAFAPPPTPPTLASAPPRPRASSTPSFVHAPTLAQATPPPTGPGNTGQTGPAQPARSIPVSVSGAADPSRSIEPSAPNPISPAASTEGNWATQHAGSKRIGRTTLVALGVFGLALVGSAAVIAVNSSKKPSSDAPPSAVAPVRDPAETHAPVLSITPPSPPPVAPPPPPGLSASAAVSAPAAPSSAPSVAHPPVQHHPRPPSHSTAAPGAPSPASTPAAPSSNPLHL
ncbi:MAG TPA: protein kinase [Polyangiaceae bacterium]|jgi:serine/threonine-protein kinase